MPFPGDRKLVYKLGGVRCGRGWVGDVKNMLLDVTKLKAKGWKPKYTSKEAVRQTMKWIRT